MFDLLELIVVHFARKNIQSISGETGNSIRSLPSLKRLPWLFS